MKRLLVLCFAILASGCVGDNCFRKNGLGVNSKECAEYRATHQPPQNPKAEWFEYVMFPLMAAGAAGEAQQSVTDSPHYQVGNLKP